MTKMDSKTIPISIQNIVATTDINKKLDLTFLNNYFKDSKYEQTRFPGLIYSLIKCPSKSSGQITSAPS